MCEEATIRGGSCSVVKRLYNSLETYKWKCIIIMRKEERHLLGDWISLSGSRQYYRKLSTNRRNSLLPCYGQCSQWVTIDFELRLILQVSFCSLLAVTALCCTTAKHWRCTVFISWRCISGFLVRSFKNTKSRIFCGNSRIFPLKTEGWCV